MKKLALAFGLLLASFAAPSYAQYACSQLTQQGLLAEFPDSAPTGSIIPRYVRNFICSTTLTIPSLTIFRANTSVQTSLFLLGNTTPADGGQGSFTFNPLDTTSADNGNTIIVDAAGHRWYRTSGGAVFSSQAANTVYAGPASGSPAFPTFRSLVVADLPTGTSGPTIPLNNGGFTQSGAATFTSTLNVTAATGYEQNGTTVLTSQVGTGFTGVGNGACGFLTASGFTSTEDLCAGNGAGSLLGTGASGNQAIHDTYIGAFAASHDKTGSFSSLVGNDSQRDAVGVLDAAYVGDFAGADYFGRDAAILGAMSLRGNAAAVSIATPAPADIVNVTITSAGLTGSPVTISSTVTGSSTPATIVADLVSKMTANPNFFADNIYANSNSQVPGLAGVFSIAHNGTNALGDLITVTTSITGGGGTTATVSYGSNGSNQLIALGSHAMDGLQITTASGSGCGGLYCLSSLTSGGNDWSFGTDSLWNVTSASDIIAIGELAGAALTTNGNCAFIGSNAFQLSTTGCGSGIGFHIGLNLTVGAPDIVGNGTLDKMNNATNCVVMGSQSVEGAGGSISTNSAQGCAVLGFRNFQNVTAANRFGDVGTFDGSGCTTCTDAYMMGYNIWPTWATGHDVVVLGTGGNGNSIPVPGGNTALSNALDVYLGNTSPVLSITGGASPSTSVATFAGSIVTNTPATSDNSTTVPTTAYVKNQFISPSFTGNTTSFSCVGAATDEQCVAMNRTASYSGGTPGFTNSMLRITDNVSAGAAAYEWGLTSVLNNSATGGQNVAVYGQGNRMTTGTGPTWGAVFEAQEQVPISNPSSGLVGLEVDNRSNGPDASQNRVGIDVVGTRFNSATGTTKISYGVRVQNGGDTGASFQTGYSVNATADVGFDTSAATTNQAAFKLAASQNISFDAAAGHQLSYEPSLPVFGNSLVYSVAGTSEFLVNDIGTVSISGGLDLNTSIGILGATNGGNVSAGGVGEYLTNTTTGTAMTSLTATNTTSLSLSAGDWDVSCTTDFTSAAGAAMTLIGTSISTSSATNGGLGALSELATNFLSNTDQNISSPTVRISVSGATTAYCVSSAGFSAGTVTAASLIRARRVR